MSNTADLFFATADDLGISTETEGARTFDPYRRIAMSSPACRVAVALARINVADRQGRLASIPRNSVGGMDFLPGDCDPDVSYGSGWEDPEGGEYSSVGGLVGGVTEDQANLAAAQASVDALEATIGGLRSTIATLGVDENGKATDSDNQGQVDALFAQIAQTDAALQQAVKMRNAWQAQLAKDQATPAPAHKPPTQFGGGAPAQAPPPPAAEAKKKSYVVPIALGAVALGLVFHKKLGF